MVDGVLVVPLGKAEGDRHEHVDLVVFAVDLDANVAALSGFGGGDDASGGFEAAEGGDLCFAPIPSAELRYEAFALLFGVKLLTVIYVLCHLCIATGCT